MHYKGDIFTIRWGSKVRCLKPPKPVPDPKNQKFKKIQIFPKMWPGALEEKEEEEKEEEEEEKKKEEEEKKEQREKERGRGDTR